MSLSFRNPRIAGSAIGLLTFMLTATLGFLWLGELVFRDVQIQQRMLLESVDKVSGQYRSAMEKLDPFRVREECSDDLLVEMRRQVYLHRDIPDIGFMRDGALLCTTGLGKLATPFVSEEQPSLVLNDGRKIFREAPIVLFDMKVLAFIIADNSFAVIIDTDRLRGLELPDIQYEIFVRPTHLQAGAPSLLGQAGLSSELDRESGWAHAFLSDTSCSRNSVWCAASRITPFNVLKHYGSIILVLSAGVIALSCLTALLGNRYFRWAGSERHRIRKALRDGEGFFTVYQPIVELESGKVIGCEVLARYQDRFGMISPAVFVPLIADWKQTWRFTSFIIDKSFRDLSLLYERFPGFRISLNVFPKDIEPFNMPNVLADPWLREAAARKLSVNLEIVETQVADLSLVSAALESFRACGFSIAIDDFGTGYSNLDQVRRIHAEYLKIDRSFVGDIEASSIRSSIVPHIVGIAESLGIKVIAEGIENKEQRQILENLGIAYGQGFYFARPMPRDEFYRSVLEPSGTAFPIPDRIASGDDEKLPRRAFNALFSDEVALLSLAALPRPE